MMIESGDFTYVTNTMGEIQVVRRQAMELSAKLNLFYNPSLVRAVLEVLRAKEIQVSHAHEQGNLDAEAVVVLCDSIQEVRQMVMERCNVNTARSAQRAFHRTRTIGVMADRKDHHREESESGAFSPRVTRCDRRGLCG